MRNPEICFLCEEESPSIGFCDVCGNKFCPECLEEHQHCLDCNGSGIYRWNVLRNRAGKLDYVHGQPTGETAEEGCRTCEETGVRK